MFEELWIIKDSLCVYHQSDSPLNLDTSLFAGFFSAFHSFQEEIFPNQYTNYIDFIENRLLFIKLSENFFLIVRDSIHRPLNRSILQLNNLSLELFSGIEANSEMKAYFFDKKVKLLSLERIERTLSPIVDQAIANLSISDEQLNKLDIMAIIIILRDLKEIILTQFYKEIFSQNAFNPFETVLLEEILSKQPINLNKFGTISYNAIYNFISNFLDLLIKNREFYSKPLRVAEKLLFSNNLLKFISANRETMQKFGITDLFLSKFVSNIVN